MILLISPMNRWRYKWTSEFFPHNTHTHTLKQDFSSSSHWQSVVVFFLPCISPPPLHHTLTTSPPPPRWPQHATGKQLRHRNNLPNAEICNNTVFLLEEKPPLKQVWVFFASAQMLLTTVLSCVNDWSWMVDLNHLWEQLVSLVKSLYH